MATSIGELFINLSIKGADKTVGALKSVGGFLGDLSSKGLAAKAAILGAIYTLERLTAGAGKYGAELKNLGTYTGTSIKYIQQLREAFRESNVDINEADQSLVGLQKALAEAAISGNAPKGLATIFGETGGDIKKMQNAAYSMGKIFQYIRKHKGDLEHTAIYNDLSESMGITQGAIVTAKRFNGEISQITKNVLADATVEKLDKVSRAWSDFEASLSNFNKKLTAKFGGPLITFLETISNLLDKIVPKIDKLTSVINPSGEAAAGVGGGPATFKSREEFEAYQRSLELGKAQADKRLSDFMSKNAASVGFWISEKWQQHQKNLIEQRKHIPTVGDRSGIAPTPKIAPPSAARGQHGSNTSNTTVNMYGVENTHDGAEELKRHVNYALRQSSAQGWVA